ncbi:hypothetical protein [Spirosoma spitsbergense]|uniref:hypothetical protein n=1 Tax=Spirosoma spitsbergense TaxID=431554 RepID=UPI000368F68A|nr:hypothetical protein [Spirosoma spitsbergense]
MTCTNLFWDFFKPLAQSVPGVNTVSQSGGDKMDRLIANSRSEDLYPAVFLLRPKYSTEDNGAGLSMAWFDATFYVVCAGNMSDELDEDRAFDEAEQMATGIAATIRSQEDNYTVLIDPLAKTFMEPVSMVTLEASYGYEVRFRIGLMINAEMYETL